MNNQFIPSKVYYEPEIQNYSKGLELLHFYSNSNVQCEKISSHNRIPELTEIHSNRFSEMKSILVLGRRKIHKLYPNNLSADFILPFTSSGCPAMCLYCYLVCNFKNCSYLRVFVNREEILNPVIKNSFIINKPTLYELGCNSDLILENSITNNLSWTIERFGKFKNSYATFATKFHMVDDFKYFKHNGHTYIRISVNPPLIVNRIELGTSSLEQRISAANLLFSFGYKVGLNIAPIILFDNWREHYISLFKTLHRELLPELKNSLFIEIIFMTYGHANISINQACFPNMYPFFNEDIMIQKSPGKLQYRSSIKKEAQYFIKRLVKNYLPHSKIKYIV